MRLRALRVSCQASCLSSKPSSKLPPVSSQPLVSFPLLSSPCPPSIPPAHPAALSAAVCAGHDAGRCADALCLCAARRAPARSVQPPAPLACSRAPGLPLTPQPAAAHPVQHVQHRSPEEGRRCAPRVAHATAPDARQRGPRAQPHGRRRCCRCCCCRRRTRALPQHRAGAAPGCGRGRLRLFAARCWAFWLLPHRHARAAGASGVPSSVVVQRARARVWLTRLSSGLVPHSFPVAAVGRTTAARTLSTAWPAASAPRTLRFAAWCL